MHKHDRIRPDSCSRAQVLLKPHIWDIRSRCRRDRQNRRRSLWEGDRNNNTDFPREAFRRGSSRFALAANRKSRFHFQESGSYGRTTHRQCRALIGEDLPEDHEPFGYAGEHF